MILRGDAVLCAESVGTRLGTGLAADGTLDPAARERTLATVRDYVAVIRRHDATLDVIATSALRRASDARHFGAEVRARTGVDPRILHGDEEAAYSFRGATYGARSAGRLGVLDVGGGSTELAVGTPDTIDRTISLEIGAVRLSERHPALLGARKLGEGEAVALESQARADVRAILAPLANFNGFGELLAVGGTVFTAAAMVSGDPLRDGVPIDRAQRRRLIRDLLARDLDARRRMANIRPQRADILPAGLIVVDEACSVLGVDSLRVSHADLLAGFLRSPEYRAATLPK
ncbi:MAG: Ppx/GppA phosphatase family protein [Candidatus Velthaea sp.]